MEFSNTVKKYGCSEVVGDRYAGEWPKERFAVHGIEYNASEKTKSDLYQEILPVINSGKVELLDHARLISQLTRLERRTARSGKDSIDHPPREHDDVANVVAGALVRCRDVGPFLLDAEQILIDTGFRSIALEWDAI